MILHRNGVALGHGAITHARLIQDSAGIETGAVFVPLPRVAPKKILTRHFYRQYHR